MLTILLGLFKNKYGRIVGYVLLGAVVALLVLVILHKPRAENRLSAKALLKQVNFIQDLDLVTHHYDEVMLIGNPMTEEEDLQAGIRDTTLAWIEFIKARADLEDFQPRYDSLSERIQRLQELMHTAQNLEEMAREERKNFPPRFLPFKKILNGALAMGNPEEMKRLEDKYSPKAILLVEAIDSLEKMRDKTDRKNFRNIPSELEAYRRSLAPKIEEIKFVEIPAGFKNRKRTRAFLRDIANKVDDFLKVEFRELLHPIDEKIENRQQRREELAKNLKDENKKMRDFQGDLKHLKLAFSSAQDNQQQKLAEYKRLKAQLDAAERNRRNNRQNQEYKILMIVPSKVTGFIDMTQVLADSQRINDKLVWVVTLPEVELTDVYFELDSVVPYPIGGEDGPSVKFRHGGIYYQVFQELKKELEYSREDIEKKALENGIVGQTCEMACTYFRDLYRVFGYEIRVILPDQEGCNCKDVIVMKPGQDPNDPSPAETPEDEEEPTPEVTTSESGDLEEVKPEADGNNEPG